MNNVVKAAQGPEADALDLSKRQEVAQMEAIEETVVKLVNFEAYVMETCISASKTLVERNLTILGHVTHGPDSGVAAMENPAIPMMAVALYKEVRESMRKGPAGSNGKPGA